MPYVDPYTFYTFWRTWLQIQINGPPPPVWPPLPPPKPPTVWPPVILPTYPPVTYPTPSTGGPKLNDTTELPDGSGPGEPVPVPRPGSFPKPGPTDAYGDPYIII